MQEHDRPQGAPVLALAGNSVSLKRMQNHAPMHAWLLYVKMEGFSGIFFSGLLHGQFCTAAGAIQVLCRREFFTIIIARSRVRSESDGR